jgi:hypothetical protein
MACTQSQVYIVKISKKKKKRKRERGKKKKLTRETERIEGGLKYEKISQQVPSRMGAQRVHPVGRNPILNGKGRNSRRD